MPARTLSFGNRFEGMRFRPRDDGDDDRAPRRPDRDDGDDHGGWGSGGRDHGHGRPHHGGPRPDPSPEPGPSPDPDPTPDPEPDPNPGPDPTPGPDPGPGGGNTPPAGAIIVPDGADLAAAIRAAPAGATLWVEGLHRLADVIEPKDGQTIIGAEGAVVSGAKLLAGWTASGGDWYVTGQTQQGDRNATDEGLDGFDRAGFPDAVYLDDAPLKAVVWWPSLIWLLA